MDVALHYGKVVFDFIFRNLVFFNLIFAIIIVFYQRRDPTSVWAWLLLLYFLPILGFLLYLLIGVDMHKRKMFKTKGVVDQLNQAIRQQENEIRNKEFEVKSPEISEYSDLVMYNLDTMGAVLTEDNDLTVFVNGRDKFDSLIQDIRNAKKFIHIQYYIIKDDLVLEALLDELKKKVQEGVEVRILFDGMGCRFVPKKLWKELQALGFKTAEFFPAILGKLQVRINYRNHRKIVVIDNKIGYVGGFNIAKEYVGLDEKFGNWRDTHLRIQGTAVSGLALRFLLDWNYTAKENLFSNPLYQTGYEPGVRDFCKMQIISSGPDSSQATIRNNYVRLIHKAKHSIYIQTPYFIPDESMLTALILAIHSGIDVNIMIPCKPDHPFVYWATYSYIGELIMEGAHCYKYENGFLHSKGIIIDESVFCYGTANMDIRSFSLNFEVNAVVYDRKKAQEMTDIFREDLKESTLITTEIYAKRPLWIRVKEQVSRLLSPLL